MGQLILPYDTAQVIGLGFPESMCLWCLQIIGRAKRAPHWGVQSRFRVIYVGMYVCRGPKSVGGNTWAKRAHAQSQYWAVKSDRIINFDYTL